MKRSELTADLLGLYVIQCVQVALPLLLIPFVARRLGPSSWGMVAYFQSIALYLALVLEFGFGLSATRTVARQRHDVEVRTTMLTEVAGAKLLLAVLVGLVALPAAFYYAPFRTHAVAFGAAVLWGVSQGFNMVWYFQGIGRMRVVATTEVATRVVAAVLILLLVRSSADGTLVLLFNAIGAAAASLITTVLAYRSAAFRWPLFRHGLQGLRSGFTLFLFRSSVSLYTLGNAFILGVFCGPAIVGYYAGAERLTKGVLSGIQPLSQTLYAHVNRAMAVDVVSAAKLARRGLFVMTGIGVILGSAIYLLAPVLVHVMLGPRFSPAIPAVRVMALLPVFICFATSVGSNWMLPMKFDRAFNVIVLGAGILNVCLAALLAPRLQQVGMGIAVTSTELCVGLSFLFYLRLRSSDPFSLATAERSVSPQSEEVKSSHIIEPGGRPMPPSELGGRLMPQPKVSIVINNYNYARFVPVAIHSALRQSYPDVEVIVVDDGSKDDSMAVLRSFESRIKTVFKANGGQGSTYNAGFAASTGDLVLFLDADDYLYENAVEQVVNVWRPGVSKIHFFLDVVEGVEGKKTGAVIPSCRFDRGDVRAQILKSGNYISPPASGNIYSRAALAELLPLPDQEWKTAADTYLIYLTPFLGATESCDQPLGAYRVHGSNQEAKTVLNAEFLRFRIWKELRRDDLIWKFCQSRNIPYERRTVHNSLLSVKLRLASKRLDSERHPIEKDELWPLAKSACKLAWNSESANPFKKLAAVGWILLFSFGPKALLPKLLTFGLVPAKRPWAMNYMISPLSWSRQRQQTIRGAASHPLVQSR